MISLGRIKSHLAIVGTAEDGYLEDLRDRAVSAIERVSGSWYGPEKEHEDILNGPALPPCRLTEPELPREVPALKLSQPLQSIDKLRSVETRPAVNAAWDSVPLMPEDDPSRSSFELDGAGRLVRVDGASWPSGSRTVRVTYDHGYDEDAGPKEARSICLELAVHWYRPAQFRQMGGAVKSASIKGASVSLDDGDKLPGDLQRRLEALRPGGLIA